MRPTTQKIIEKTTKYGAQNYHPLPVVLTRGEGVWVWDVEGNKYMDMLSAYSSLSHGHRHPKILAALQTQCERITMTSRAFHNELLGEMYERIAHLTGLPKVLPMNSGTEAVETAIKVARKWGYEKKKVSPDRAEIIVCRNNFHGRSVTIISSSTEDDYRNGFGPFTPGFSAIKYGDIDALQAAIGPNTVGFLVEPIQGEAGIIIPPVGFMKAAEQLCRQHNVLLLADEVQTGLGRTGKLFACDHDGAKPDIMILGKSLGGGVLPVSAVAATEAVMSVLKPGQHGSTFGGNPLSAAVAIAALDVLVEEKLPERAAELGDYLMAQLSQIKSSKIKQLRGRGLLIGIDLYDHAGGARSYCEALMELGLLCKETHETVIRLAPPLVITRDEVDWAVIHLKKILSDG